MAAQSDAPTKPPEKLVAPGRPANPAAARASKHGAPQAEKRKLKKFRVLAGTHSKDAFPPYYSCCGALLNHPHEPTCTAAQGTGAESIVRETKRFIAGDIVADYSNLAKRWPEKYQRVDDALPEGTPPPDNATDDDLEDLNLRQLKGIAVNIEADLSEATTKEDIIAAIRARRQQMSDDGED